MGWLRTRRAWAAVGAAVALIVSGTVALPAVAAEVGTIDVTVAGVPAEEAQAFSFSASCGEAWSYASPDEAGVAVLTDLPEDATCTLSFADNAEKYIDGDLAYDGENLVATPNWDDVAQVAVGADVVVAPKLASAPIVGSVVLEDGGDPSGLSINAQGASGWSAWGWVDPGGSFTIRGLAEDAYTLQVTGWNDDYVDGYVHADGEALDLVPTSAEATTFAPGASLQGVAVAVGETLAVQVEGFDDVADLQQVDVSAYGENGFVTSLARLDQEAGTYTAAGLPAMQYKLNVSTWGGRYLGGWVRALGDGRVEVVSSEEEASSFAPGGDTVVLTLPTAGSLQGTIVNETLPAQATVSAYGSRGGWGSAEVDGSGAWYIGGLVPDEEYTLSVTTSDPGFRSGDITQEGDNFVVVPTGEGTPLTPQDATSISFSLPIGASVSGSVQASADTAAGVWVAALDDEGTWLGGSSVAEDGSFVLSGLDPDASVYLQVDAQLPTARGGYVRAQDGGYVLVDEIADATSFAAGSAGITFSLRPAATISGTLVDIGGGAESASVAAQPVDGGSEVYGYASEDGSYVIGGLEPGAVYRLRFSDWSGSHVTGWVSGTAGAYELVQSQSDATELTAGAEGVSFAPPVAASISGRLILEPGDDPASIWIDLSSELYGVGGGASPAEDGTFTVDGLWPGTRYRAYLYAGTSGYLSGNLVADGDEFTTTAFWADATLLEAGVAGIAVRLATGGSLSGRLLGVPAEELEHFTVSASPTQAGVGASATPDADGTFTLTGLDPSVPYSLWVSDDGSGPYVDGYVTGSPGGYALAPDWSARTSFEVGTAGITVAPVRGVSISGQVVGYDTAVSPSLYIQAIGTDGGTVTSVDVADDGRFNLGGLTAGVAYTLMISDNGTYVDGYLHAAGAGYEAGPRDGASAIVAPAEIQVFPEEGVSIRGTLTGIDPADAGLFQISASTPGADGAWAFPEADGSFELVGLDQDAQYSLFVRSGVYGKYVTGWAWATGNGYLLVDGLADATPIAPGATRVAITVKRAGSPVTGTVTGLPADYQDEMWVLHAVGRQTRAGGYGTVRKDGTFAIAGLDPSDSYIVELTTNGDGESRGFLQKSGSFHGLVTDKAKATAVAGTASGLVVDLRPASPSPSPSPSVKPSPTPKPTATPTPSSTEAADKRTAAEKLPRPGVVVREGDQFSAFTVTNAGDLGRISVEKPATAPIVAVWQNATALNRSETSRNAWAVAPDGKVYTGATGSGPAAAHFGDASNLPLNKPIVGMSPTASGRGYWLVASDGGIFTFGDAKFYGSTGAMILNKPIVGMSVTPTGKGYWLVASDGGIFTFGDARFLGSTGAITLNQPIMGMTATPSGKGYWMVASDGGVFTFGDATFKGSTGGLVPAPTVAGMIPWGTGYMLIGADARLYPFK